MRGFDAYRRQQTTSFSRIDILIAAYDGIITRLRDAQTLLKKDKEDEALPLLVRAQRLVVECYGGLDLQHGTVPNNVKKLYLFVLGRIGLGDDLDLPGAIKVLQTLKEGLLSVREEVVQMENAGQLRAVEDERLFRNVVV